MNTDFLCPECGGREASEEALVETDFNERDAWSGVLQRYRCRACGAVVPAHLAERWHGLSAEAARKEWLEQYRDSQPGWD